MLEGVWGKKIGMTQIFTQDKVIPVTVIGLDNWVITDIKNKDKNGYDAVQAGLVKKKYTDKKFSKDWLKQPKKYFDVLREISISELSDDMVVGKSLDPAIILQAGQFVNVFGITKGRGFQGVVKRHGFSGGPKTHGSKLGRAPGSIGFFRSQGKVVKGQPLPGHMGVERRVMKNLEIIKVEPESNVVLVKGSIPGGSGSLVFMQKV